MAEAFQRDLTCSVCLDLFTEPVLLACGHCFCQPCIAAFWHSPEREASCPECRAPCPDRKYTPSRLLRSLAQKAWQLQEEEDGADGGGGGGRPGQQAEKPGGDGGKGRWQPCCEAHGDSLALFCLSDKAPACYRCVGSPAHAGHSFVSLQDGARESKEKLARGLESLEVRIEKLQGRERSQEEQMASLRDSAVSLRQNIEARFSELQEFLNQRKDAMLAQLEEEEKDVHSDMENHLCQIQEQLFDALDLRSEGRAVMKTTNPATFLSEIQPFLHIMTGENEDREDSSTVLCKELCLGKFKGPIQYLACTALCSAFQQGLEPLQLDTKTSHPIFIIYQKGTSVTTQPNPQKHCANPERFENYRIVLGESGFSSGEHYWEIQTKDAAEWIIGVAAESIERKVRVTSKDILEKVWAVQLPIAKDISPEDGTTGQRFGVYLDYDKGQLSFYDAKTCHFYTHRAQFKEKVYPCFWYMPRGTGKNVSLTICHKQDM